MDPAIETQGALDWLFDPDQTSDGDPERPRVITNLLDPLMLEAAVLPAKIVCKTESGVMVDSLREQIEEIESMQRRYRRLSAPTSGATLTVVSGPVDFETPKGWGKSVDVRVQPS